MAGVEDPATEPARAKSFEGDRPSAFLARTTLQYILDYCKRHCKRKSKLTDGRLHGLAAGDAQGRIKRSIWGKNIKERGLDVLLAKWLPRDPHASLIVVGAVAIIGASMTVAALKAQKKRPKKK